MRAACKQAPGVAKKKHQRVPGKSKRTEEQSERRGKKERWGWRRRCECNRLHPAAKPTICPFPRTSSCFTLKSLSSPNPLWNQRVRVDDRITRWVEMV